MKRSKQISLGITFNRNQDNQPTEGRETPKRLGAFAPREEVLFGALRLTLRFRSGPPLRAFYDAARRSQGGMVRDA
jgi:hypothetical protein